MKPLHEVDSPPQTLAFHKKPRSVINTTPMYSTAGKTTEGKPAGKLHELDLPPHSQIQVEASGHCRGADHNDVTNAYLPLQVEAETQFTSDIIPEKRQDYCGSEYLPIAMMSPTSTLNLSSCWGLSTRNTCQDLWRC